MYVEPIRGGNVYTEREKRERREKREERREKREKREALQKVESGGTPKEQTEREREQQQQQQQQQHITMPDVKTCLPMVKAMILLDSEGKRITVKYYTKEW